MMNRVFNQLSSARQQMTKKDRGGIDEIYHVTYANKSAFVLARSYSKARSYFALYCLEVECTVVTND